MEERARHNRCSAIGLDAMLSGDKVRSGVRTESMVDGDGKDRVGEREHERDRPIEFSACNAVDEVVGHVVIEETSSECDQRSRRDKWPASLGEWTANELLNVRLEPEEREEVIGKREQRAVPDTLQPEPVGI